MGNRVKKVIVVGAGPVGLLTALMLGQLGIPVDVVEASDKLNTSPRGLAYGPAASRVLRRAGILDTMIQRGVIAKDIAWRKPNGEMISGLDDVNINPDPMVIYPVGSLSALLLEQVLKQSTASILWRHKVVDVGQNDDQAWIDVDDEKGNSKRLHADFVVGCDGGQSRVRKRLFEGRFPGYTWPVQLISVNIYYPFDKFGWSDCQWIIHPDEWFLVCKISADGLWRLAYGEESGLSMKDVRDRQADRFRRTLPGSPEPSDYQIVNVAPFQVSQRLAERMRVGRILLAGDAAHLCNTMGGLGLTTGVSDVGSLIDCLAGINSGEASMEILEQYSQVRRKIFSEIIDPTSTANFKRIMQEANENIGQDPFFQLLDRAKRDPQVAAQMLEGELSIGCDMTEYYDKKTKIVTSTVIPLVD